VHMSELVIAVLAVAACVYGTSAVAKLASRRSYIAFRDGLGETSLVPHRLLRKVAAVLVGGETIVAVGTAAAAVLTGAGLVGARPVTTAALACATVLTGVLAAGVSVVVHAGTHATCACFGVRPGRTGPTLGAPHLARNLGLLALLVAGLISNEFTHGRPNVAAVLVAVVAGAVVALLAIMLDDLVALFAPVQRQAVR
jgi:hypothetical protein